MEKLKSLLMVAALTAMPFYAHAQDDASGKGNDFRTHSFVQVQGGLHLPFGSGSIGDVMQPSFGANLGAWFAPAVGARVGFEGLKSKVVSDGTAYGFNYYTIGLDGLFNLSALFGKQNNPRLNAILLAGVGLTHFDDKDFLTSDNGTNLAHNFRVGAALEYRVSKPLSLSLEYRVNNTSDAFNGLLNNKDDWHSSLLIGVAYNFAHSKKLYAERFAPVAVLPLSLYEQKEQSVDQRMNTWMKRMKGESKTDYLARTSDAAMQSQRLEFSKTISTQMAGNRAQSTLSDLSYNTKAQLLGIGFGDMPTITLRVPGEEAQGIKGTGDVQFANTVYNLNPGDKFEVLYTDVIIPSTGKKYTYVSTRDAQFVESDYQPLATVQQEMLNSQRLAAAAATAAAQEAPQSKDIQVGNTTVTVTTEKLPKADGKKDFKVSYVYTVKDGFSAADDFEAGKYDADKSKASAALLRVINESLAGEYAQYAKAGAVATIKYEGSADATPINSPISYNGRYGDIKNQTVTVNGKAQTMTITRATGITSNEQLSLVRAISVRNYIMKNVKALKDMKVNDSFSVKVSPNEGSEYRRVCVEFLFPDAN